MTKAAASVRSLAESVKLKKSDEFKQMEDQLFEEISKKAKEGLFGCMMTIQLPHENQDELVSLLGELRGAGFTVETLSLEEVEYKTSLLCQMMVTW